MRIIEELVPGRSDGLLRDIVLVIDQHELSIGQPAQHLKGVMLVGSGTYDDWRELVVRMLDALQEGSVWKVEFREAQRRRTFYYPDQESAEAMEAALRQEWKSQDFEATASACPEIRFSEAD